MKYIKIMCLGIFLMGLLSCGKVGKINASLTGYSFSCIQGVEYIQFTSGATVAYNKDGSIKTCQ